MGLAMSAVSSAFTGSAAASDGPLSRSGPVRCETDWMALNTHPRSIVTHWRNAMRSTHALIAAVLLASCDSSTEPSGEVRLDAVTATELTGVVGSQVLPVPIVRAIGPGEAPVDGIPIVFQVGPGDGSIANARVYSDSLGLASVERWTLGTVAGVQRLTASFNRGPSVTFSARADPGGVEEITRISGDAQIAQVGEALLMPLTVRVADRFGNPAANAEVTFEVASGGGYVDSEPTVVDVHGIASSGLWTLGSEPGVQEVRARSLDVETTFTANACRACPTFLFVRGSDILRTIVNGGQGLSLTSGLQPTWSPDGQRIAFVRYLSDEGRYDIFLMDADGSNIVRRTFSGGNGPSTPGFRSPTWSPDGTRLAVATGGTYEGTIYVLSVDDDGTNPVALTVTGMAADPAWSPDGSQIAFVSLSGDDGYNALHVMNADGSDVREVTPRDTGGIDRPTWSPDGEAIAFAKCISGSCNLYSVGVDGSALVQITHGLIAHSPAWSPDGAWIAFTVYATWTDSQPSIALVHPGGGDDPIAALADGTYPAWRP